MRSIRFLAILFFVGSFLPVKAQLSKIYVQPGARYRIALELYNKQKYGAAREVFTEVLKNNGVNKSNVSVCSQYYQAVCALELFHEDAEYLLKNFIENNPESTRIKMAYFNMGRLHFRKKKFEKAIDAFKSTDVAELSNEELIEYHYKVGYSYFETEKYKDAKQELFEILNQESKYKVPVTYYYSHIAYIEKNYETALNGFLKLVDDKMFGPIVPYYIAQIYYLQGNYEKVISYAPALLDSTNVKRASEIAKILGESYYNLGKYPEAIPYLLMYKEKSLIPFTRRDFYQLGYSYYKTAKYEEAVEFFKAAANRNDTLAQHSFYHLADCFIKLDKKNYARSSFLEASKMNFDPEIREDALFNYAKLAYDLSYNPYNEAIKAFQQYITEYPKSLRITEAYTYLFNLFLTTNNYKDALASIEKIELKDDQLKTAFQKIAFNRAVELYNNEKLDDALVLFKKSAQYPYSKKLQSLSYYWMGELAYRKAKYSDAISNFKTFLATPGAASQPQYELTNYNIGWCYFNLKDWDNASIWYRKYIKDPVKEDDKHLSDAYLRTGDSYYIRSQYDEAFNYYSEAVKLKAYDMDYALYQKALNAGLTKKYDVKKQVLKDLIENYPNSNYVADATYDLGALHQDLGEDAEALNVLGRYTNEYPQSKSTIRALSKIGLIQYTTKDYDNAIVTFKKIIVDYPGTEEAKGALSSLRNIYVDQNKVDDFFTFVKGLSNQNITNEAQDSTVYQAVINIYLNGDCDNAIKGFKDYNSRFPSGHFILKSNYYRALCEMKNKNLDGALESFNFIISKPKSEYTEECLLKASKILVDKEKFEDAAVLYDKLEQVAEDPQTKSNAPIWRMRCLIRANKHQEIIPAAKRVLQLQKVTKELDEEAHLAIARAAFAIDSFAMASGEYQYIIKISKNESGAEAKYRISEIYFKQGLYTECEKSIFELVNQVPSYDYWVAKGFILLSDNYIKMGNVFQAKHTLKSIIDNYEGADLVQEAQTKYNAILLEEKRKLEEEELLKKQKQEEEEKKQQIEFNNTQEQQKLFSEPVLETIPDAEEKRDTEPVPAIAPEQSTTPEPNVTPEIKAVPDSTTTPEVKPEPENAPAPAPEQSPNINPEQNQDVAPTPEKETEPAEENEQPQNNGGTENE